jgi:cobalt/nickel transport system permease protein
MHIPDGFLTPPVWGTLDAISAPAVAWVARRAQRDTQDQRIPLLGVMGAFVFAAQMINFPVGLGTSGHLVGGALLAMVLGPSAAVVVMTAILVIQAFVFQDGGVMALGANIINMGLAGVLAGYLPYRLWGAAPAWRKAAIFAGGMLSVLVSAVLALAQLAISGVPLQRWLPVSLTLFLVSAILEGAITVAAVAAIERLNATWVRRPAGAGASIVGFVILAAILPVALAVFLASSAPDGIARLASQIGITAHAPAWLHAPLADYDWQSIHPTWMRKASAAFTGMALLYGACVITGRVISRQRSS